MRWSISGRARREFGGLNTFNTDPALEDSKRQTAEKPSGWRLASYAPSFGTNRGILMMASEANVFHNTLM